MVAARSPRIAYENLLESADTVVASSEEALYPSEYAYDGQEWSHWTPASAGAATLTATFSSAVSVSYFAFFGHDLAANSGTIKLEYSTNGGGSYSAASSVWTPTDTAPVYEHFNAISAATWKVTMDSNPASSIAMIAFGSDFQCEHGVVVGMSPPKLARNNQVMNATSERGIALGRSLISQGSSCSLDLAHHTTTFMNATWLPFMRAAEVGPFFLLWNPNDYPTDAAVCWSEGQIGKPSFSKTTLMQTSINFLAKVE